MEISDATAQSKEKWNAFVHRHYPPIGSFMQTWEWGEFQKALGRKMQRYFITDGPQLLAAFTLVHYSLPLGLHYGYIPRGPVIAQHAATETMMLIKILERIKTWAVQKLPRHIFLRLEPALAEISPTIVETLGFRHPSYYIQPRHNLAISLQHTEEEIIRSFHPSTRSNLARAKRRGVNVEMRNEITDADYKQFQAMMHETIQRNSGHNAYPSDAYFRSLFASIPFLDTALDSHTLTLGAFYGYQDNQPAATHFVLFFGDTATYLYGASYTKHLNSKVTTYLHWEAIREAKRRGLRYYDLGGVDENRWPKLTTFKQQFRGEKFSYIGNLDLPLRPCIYGAYNLFRKLKS